MAIDSTTSENVNPFAGQSPLSIFPLKPPTIGQGTWALNANTSQFLNGFMNNSSGTNGDNFTYKVYLAVGTYDLSVLCYKNSNMGIMEITIDGTQRINEDLYSAGATWNHVINTSFSVSSAGLVDFVVNVNGKNASSSGYYINLSCVMLTRTA